MFDPRDDARDCDGREDGRGRLYDERDRDDDPREGLIRDLDLPRGEERELVVHRDRVYELDGDDSRTLAAVGAFRVSLSACPVRAGASRRPHAHARGQKCRVVFRRNRFARRRRVPAERDHVRRTDRAAPPSRG
jgi:hypothetical protein